MVPWRYLKADAQEDINLRCLLLRMGARSTATPGDLYGVARSALAATGRACAVVAYYSSRRDFGLFAILLNGVFSNAIFSNDFNYLPSDLLYCSYLATLAFQLSKPV
jgi:hypothetical protein